MTALITVRKEECDRLTEVIAANFPIGSGGAVGQLLSVIYDMAEHSFSFDIEAAA